MNNKIMQITALFIIAATLVLFSSCSFNGKNNGVSTTVRNHDAVKTTVQESTSASLKPDNLSNTSDIVNYYNNCIDALPAKGFGYKKDISCNQTALDCSSFSSNDNMTDSLMASVKKAFGLIISTDSSTTNYDKNNADSVSAFTVGNISESDVTNASFSSDTSTSTLVLNLKNESNPQKGGNSSIDKVTDAFVSSAEISSSLTEAGGSSDKITVGISSTVLTLKYNIKAKEIKSVTIDFNESISINSPKIMYTSGSKVSAATATSVKFTDFDF